MTALGPTSCEEVADRALAGFVLVDASSRRRIQSGLQVAIPSEQSFSLFKNRNSVWSIVDTSSYIAQSQDSHSNPTDSGSSMTVDICILDPERRFLSQKYRLYTSISQGDSVRRDGNIVPQEILIFPSASGSLCAGLCPLRVFVQDSAGRGIPWALVRIMPSSSAATALAVGLCDERGMALIGIPNVPLFSMEKSSVRLAKGITVCAQVFHIPWHDSLGPSLVDFSQSSLISIRDDQIKLMPGNENYARLEQESMP